jgi:hypothetical protein
LKKKKKTTMSMMMMMMMFLLSLFSMVGGRPLRNDPDGTDRFDGGVLLVVETASLSSWNVLHYRTYQDILSQQKVFQKRAATKRPPPKE